MLNQNRKTQSNEEYNINLVRRLFEGMLDPKHMEQYDQLFANTIHLHGPASGFEGDIDISQGKAFDSRLAHAFKKSKLELSELFAKDDKVIAYWILHAIHRTNNKKIVLTGTSIYRIQNGKICEIWQSWDRLGLLEQLGEVRVSSNLVDLEPNYDTLKQMGLEKYLEHSLTLTTRERQCLKLLIQSKTAKETAEELKLSYRTVESYLDNIKTKLRCQNKRKLLQMAQTLEKLSLL